MDKEFVRKVFQRDYSGILGFDIYELLSDMTLVNHTWFKQFPDLFKDSFQSLAHVTARLLDEYLDYDEKNFPNPLDQYIKIYECKDEILAVVDNCLKVNSPKEDPAQYMMWCWMRSAITRLLNNIVSCGSAHKFDEDMLRSTHHFDEPIYA